MDKLPEGWVNTYAGEWQKKAVLYGVTCVTAAVIKVASKYRLTTRDNNSGWSVVKTFDTLEAAITYYEMIYG